jgi:hypothetical protein
VLGGCSTPGYESKSKEERKRKGGREKKNVTCVSIYDNKM